MKYKPSRDIPIASQQLNTLSPTKLRKWIMQHRTRKDPKTGRKVQHVVHPEAITNWLRRHPQIRRELKQHIDREDIVEEETSEGLFQNGVFQQIPCVNEWIIQLRARGAKETTIKHYFVAQLRRMCQGILRGRGKKMSRKILFLLLVISFLFIAGIISYALVIRYMFIDGSISVGSL
jgi:hypothetical protein